MKMLKILFFLLTPLLFASDYTVKQIDVLPIDSYPARITVDKITVAADPYPDNAKSFTAFDVKNLNSRGYFPVNLVIRNDSQYYLKLKTQNIFLETRLGELLYSTPAAMVVEDLVGNKYVDSLTHLKDGERLSETVASPLSDFTTKGLNNILLEPGKVQSGFLFFYTEKHKRSLFIGSTLHIPNLKEEGTDRSFGPFDIPLDPALSDSKK